MLLRSAALPGSPSSARVDPSCIAAATCQAASAGISSRGESGARRNDRIGLRPRDLLHSGALTRAIIEIAALGDDAVEHGAHVLEPPLCLGQFGGGRRQSNSRRVSQTSMGKIFELA